MVATNDVATYHYVDARAAVSDKANKAYALAEIDASGVQPRQRWRHWKGGYYTIIALGLVEKTMDPCVVYAGGDGVVWVRSLPVWLEEAAPRVARFTRIYDDQPSGCALQADSCKSANCETHGVLHPREPAHPMMPQPREGRFL